MHGSFIKINSPEMSTYLVVRGDSVEDLEAFRQGLNKFDLTHQEENVNILHD